MSDENPVQPPTEILPGLWQAGLPLDWSWVHRTGVETVVDVADPDQLDDPAELEGIHYVKQALVDGELPDLDLLGDLVDGVVLSVQAGRTTLVHCGFGKNRSGLVVALAARELLGVSGAEALAHVRSVRDRAVNNEEFAAYVESLPAQHQRASADATQLVSSSR
ncbi:dual specificity protein phosphatase-like protein [Motilibacter peucedani]|uniref:Dual specificity protein phosphatase-like protein n=1 Tax=Motilibacter peucedani TaxID=598650 RepID=A0A420XL99_9ACTN|nr:dual specificity protein phosphatase family protein [Motilibacter peucedani]RKS69306.1 dual specificity protein phosphatase-like protein [Motilibacter peucedani]